MKLDLHDPTNKARREAIRFQIVVWIVIIGSLVGLWFLYENVAWVRSLLGTSRSTAMLGVVILASPLILLMYVFEKLRK